VRLPLLILLLLLAAVDGAADEDSRVVFVLPIEVDADFGAANGNAVINRYLPLLGVPLGSRWGLINLTMAYVADAPGGVPGRPGNPDPGSGGRAFGFGDVFDAVFLNPPTSSPRFVWGLGPAFGFPTASDARLGSGKWTFGPALRAAYRPGPWNLGFVAMNLTSYSGDPDRRDVDQLLVRALIRRRLTQSWYLTINPVITADWNAGSGQRWLVPFGGGIGHIFRAFDAPMALSIQAYHNSIRPDGAPDWLLRVNVTVSLTEPPLVAQER
jgi:hypothetical protein